MGAEESMLTHSNAGSSGLSYTKRPRTPRRQLGTFIWAKGQWSDGHRSARIVSKLSMGPPTQPDVIFPLFRLRGRICGGHGAPGSTYD